MPMKVARVRPRYTGEDVALLSGDSYGVTLESKPDLRVQGKIGLRTFVENTRVLQGSSWIGGGKESIGVKVTPTTLACRAESDQDS